jgi:predicted DNA-binding protein
VVVYRDAMAKGRDIAPKVQRGGKAKSEAMPRTSVSFPPEVYKSLLEIAAQKKVSAGWVVREAVEKYLGDQFPLFGTSLLKRGQ